MIRLIVGATLSMVLGAGAVAQQPIVIGQTILQPAAWRSTGVDWCSAREHISRRSTVRVAFVAEPSNCERLTMAAMARARRPTPAHWPVTRRRLSSSRGPRAVPVWRASGSPLRHASRSSVAQPSSPDLREPFNPYSFPVRAPHLLEFGRLIDTATQLGERRFGFLYSPGATGEKHLANVLRVLGVKGLQLALALPLNPKAAPAELAKKISDAQIDVVFNHGSYATIAAIYKADRSFDRRTRFMAINSGAQQMVKSLGDLSGGLVFTQVVPFPWSSALRVVREYRAALASIDATAEPSFSSLEGYIDARVLTLAL